MTKEYSMTKENDYFAYLHPYTIILPHECDYLPYDSINKAIFFRRVLTLLGINVKSEYRSMPTEPQIMYRIGGHTYRSDDIILRKVLRDILENRVPKFVYDAKLIDRLKPICLYADKHIELLVVDKLLTQLESDFRRIEDIFRFGTEYDGFGIDKVQTLDSNDFYDGYMITVDDTSAQDDEYTRFNTSVDFMVGALTRLSHKQFGGISIKYKSFKKSSGTLVWARYPEIFKDTYHSDICHFLGDCALDTFDKPVKWYSHSEPTSSIRFNIPFLKSDLREYLDTLEYSAQGMNILDWVSDRDECRSKRLINIGRI